MVERYRGPGVITFLVAEPFTANATVRLAEDASQHARVRRVQRGEAARVLDGRGRSGEGTIEDIARDHVDVMVHEVRDFAPPPPLDVVVPVADRDRMLFAAEKCAELQVTTWRPAYFERSRSVSPRGEGEKFRARVVARMQAALEQSGGAWLPDVHPEHDAGDVLSSVPAASTRIVLDASGPPLASLASLGSRGPVALAVGPEGGFESAELDLARSLGWTVASLGATTLRFETAIIAAVAVVRALQPSTDTQHG